MRYRKIPDETIRRLPIYLRGLLYSLDDGRESISSKDLGDLIAVNPCQIRKDFSYFGDFGTPGVGYKIDKLTKQISKILTSGRYCLRCLPVRNQRIGSDG